jgi:hypothetical protein
MGFAGQDAVADGKPVLDAEVRNAARAFVRDDFEMIGLAANDAPQRDKGVEGTVKRS